MSCKIAGVSLSDEFTSLFVSLARSYDVTTDMVITNNLGELTKKQHDAAMAVNLLLYKACAALEKLRGDKL